MGIVWTLAGLASSCGGGGGHEAADFNGFWILEAVTDEFGGPSDVTLYRGGAPLGLVGDVVIAATSSTEATLSLRVGVVGADPADDPALGGPVLQGPVDSFEGVVTVDGDRWLVVDDQGTPGTGDDTVTVFTAELLPDDTLILTADPSDPDNTTIDGPSIVQLERAPAWSNDFDGTWQITDFDGTDPRVCTDTGSGAYQTVEIDFVIDDRWWNIQNETVSTYTTMDCSDVPTTSMSSRTGLAEIDATTLRLYFYDDVAMEGLYLEFDYVKTGTGFDLTLAACDPGASCADVPSSVTLTSPPSP